VYYQLDCDEATMTAYVVAVKRPRKNLIRGLTIDPVGESPPFRYRYKDATNSPLFDFYSGPNLMSKRLVSALEQAGVDNLQKFEAELVDETTGQVNTEFWVVNIVGLVECADLASSRTSELGSSYYFHELVIDPNKTQGLLMFRLAQSGIDILVHQKVATAIEQGKFRGVTLTALSESP
jgi:hypothetical protein